MTRYIQKTIRVGQTQLPLADSLSENHNLVDRNEKIEDFGYLQRSLSRPNDLHSVHGPRQGFYESKTIIYSI